MIFNTGHQNLEAWGEMKGEQFYHSSYTIEQYKELLKEHNFEIIKLAVTDEQCHGRTVWIAKYNSMREY